MFDTSFHFKGKQLSGSEIYEDGLKLADTWLARKKDAEMANIKRQTQDITDPDNRFAKMIGLAKQSKRSPWLIADLEAEKSAAEKAEIANREKMANINETISKANKNNADASQTVQKTGQARIGSLKAPAQALLMTGNIDFALDELDTQYKAGAIDDETYQNFSARLQTLKNTPNLKPEEIMNVGNAMFKGILPPEYSVQTANNMADNQTKFDIAKMDNETKFGIAQMNDGTERAIAQAKIDHENSQIDAHYQWQQNAIKSGQAKVVEIDGRMALDFGNGQYAPYVGKDGKPTTPAPKPESRADREKRQLDIINLEQSHDQMQQGLNLVDKVSKAFEAIGKGNGLIGNGVFAAQSYIPGTDAHALMGHIETLKSNVFLTQVEKMKGLGALTDTEGKKLESAIANLNPYSKDFATSLVEIKATLEQAKQRIAQKQAVYEQADFEDAFYLK